MRHWLDLTKEQKKVYGCGPGRFLIAQFCFYADCRQHDFYYKQGGGILNKVEADFMFYAHMLKDVNNYQGLKKWEYFGVATLYFVAVLTFGVFFYNWK